MQLFACIPELSVAVISSYQSVISLMLHGWRVIHEIKCKHFFWCAWWRGSVCNVLAQHHDLQCGVIACHVELISSNNGSTYFLQSVFTTVATLNHFVQQLLFVGAGNSLLTGVQSARTWYQVGVLRSAPTGFGIRKDKETSRSCLNPLGSAAWCIVEGTENQY